MTAITVKLGIRGWPGWRGDPNSASANRDGRRHAPCPAVRPGYHTDKRHWNTVYLDQPLPRDVPWNRIEASYELVRGSLTKRAQAALPSE